MKYYCFNTIEKTRGGVEVGVGRVLRQACRIFIQIFKIRGIFNKHMSKAAYRGTSNKDEKVAPSMLMSSCTQGLWLEVFKNF